MLGLEVLSDDADDRDVGEVACGDGEVCDRAAELVGFGCLRASRRRRTPSIRRRGVSRCGSRGAG